MGWMRGPCRPFDRSFRPLPRSFRIPSRLLSISIMKSDGGLLAAGEDAASMTGRPEGDCLGRESPAIWIGGGRAVGWVRDDCQSSVLMSQSTERGELDPQARSFVEVEETILLGEAGGPFGLRGIADAPPAATSTAAMSPNEADVEGGSMAEDEEEERSASYPRAERRER